MRITRIIKIPALFALVVAVGVVAGFFSSSGDQVRPTAFASYPEFPGIGDLARSSDAIVRGQVIGNGEPFIDRGLAPGAAVRQNDDPGVAMRAYTVQVTAVSGAAAEAPLLTVVALDPEVFGTASGDAVLSDGEDLFLFLERSEGATALNLLDVPAAFSVIGGRQGVYRNAGDGMWRRDLDPHIDSREDPLVFDDDVVDGTDLEKVATDWPLSTRAD